MLYIVTEVSGRITAFQLSVTVGTLDTVQVIYFLNRITNVHVLSITKPRLQTNVYNNYIFALLIRALVSFYNTQTSTEVRNFTTLQEMNHHFIGDFEYS